MSSFTLFFFNDTATTEIYTLSLHDALPISGGCEDRDPRWAEAAMRQLTASRRQRRGPGCTLRNCAHRAARDRKSTRLNSSHPSISYAVFCLKKKKKATILSQPTMHTAG